jgi:hypothetical protein
MSAARGFVCTQGCRIERKPGWGTKRPFPVLSLLLRFAYNETWKQLLLPTRKEALSAMMRMLFSLIFLLIALSSCGGESFYFPEGDAEAGKQVFTELKCYACHEVVGEDFPDPSAITPTFVALGATGEQKPRLYLVESIIAPSHQFAQPRPPAGQTSSEQNIRAGTRSRMSDYSEQLTVRELCDLVSYLEAIQGTGGTQVGSF